jgi:hypothetical protein
MTPEREIERIKKDFLPHWRRLVKLPTIQKALQNNNPVLLAELASKEVFGDFATADSQKRKRMKDILSYRPPED